MGNKIKSKLEGLNRYYFDKDTTYQFINFLKEKATVISPHKKGDVSYSFQEVKNADDVVLEYPRTIQPLKKMFMPPKEVLINFNLKSNKYNQPEIKPEKRIFFGVHSYEMQSVKRLDFSFTKGHPESNYLTRRENSLFIGVAFEPDEWHFSSAVGIDIEETDGFAIYFYPLGPGYLVFEITQEGGNLIRDFGLGKLVNDQDLEIEQKEFKTKIKYHYNRLPEIFKHVYNSKVWENVAQTCLGCGTCNLLCPTCYCFDVQDEIELDAENGQRSRSWDSCMLRGFAEVSGGENFRNSLGERTRHRLFRKFKYITEQSGNLHCVGCGRCSSYCPADISLVEIVNKLIDDYSDQQKKEAI